MSRRLRHRHVDAAADAATLPKSRMITSFSDCGPPCQRGSPNLGTKAKNVPCLVRARYATECDFSSFTASQAAFLAADAVKPHSPEAAGLPAAVSKENAGRAVTVFGVSWCLPV